MWCSRPRCARGALVRGCAALPSTRTAQRREHARDGSRPRALGTTSAAGTGDTASRAPGSSLHPSRGVAHCPVSVVQRPASEPCGSTFVALFSRGMAHPWATNASFPRRVTPYFVCSAPRWRSSGPRWRVLAPSARGLTHLSLRKAPRMRHMTHIAPIIATRRVTVAPCMRESAPRTRREAPCARDMRATRDAARAAGSRAAPGRLAFGHGRVTRSALGLHGTRGGENS